MRVLLSFAGCASVGLADESAGLLQVMNRQSAHNGLQSKDDCSKGGCKPALYSFVGDGWCDYLNPDDPNAAIVMGYWVKGVQNCIANPQKCAEFTEDQCRAACTADPTCWAYDRVDDEDYVECDLLTSKGQDTGGWEVFYGDSSDNILHSGDESWGGDLFTCYFRNESYTLSVPGYCASESGSYLNFLWNEGLNRSDCQAKCDSMASCQGFDYKEFDDEGVFVGECEPYMVEMEVKTNDDGYVWSGTAQEKPIEVYGTGHADVKCYVKGMMTVTTTTTQICPDINHECPEGMHGKTFMDKHGCERSSCTKSGNPWGQGEYKLTVETACGRGDINCNTGFNVWSEIHFIMEDADGNDVKVPVTAGEVSSEFGNPDLPEDADDSKQFTNKATVDSDEATCFVPDNLGAWRVPHSTSRQDSWHKYSVTGDFNKVVFDTTYTCDLLHNVVHVVLNNGLEDVAEATLIAGDNALHHFLTVKA